MEETGKDIWDFEETESAVDVVNGVHLVVNELSQLINKDFDVTQQSVGTDLFTIQKHLDDGDFVELNVWANREDYDGDDTAERLELQTSVRNEDSDDLDDLEEEVFDISDWEFSDEDDLMNQLINRLLEHERLNP